MCGVLLLSGEYVSRLKRRARAFLLEATRVGDPDLGMFFAEQAMQLYIKAVYYELFGERVRGHRLRELLSLFVKMLEAQGFKDLANKVLVIVDQNRRLFILAEDAYSMARYGDIGYSREEVDEVVKLAQKLVDVLEEVVKSVKLG